MKNIKTRVGLTASCFVPLFACAQLSLTDCQRLAEEHYPSVQKYGLIQQTKNYTVKQIQQGYLPKIAVTGQVSMQNEVPSLPETLEQMLTAQGKRVKGLEKDQYRVGVDVHQLLWDGGQIAVRKRMARTQGDVEEAKNDVELYALRSRVNELYFGLLWLEQQVALNKEYTRLLESNRERLEHLLKGGMVMQADVDALRAEELVKRQQLHSLQHLQQGLQQVLALFIGRGEHELDRLQKPALEDVDEKTNLRPELHLFSEQKKLTEMQTDLLNRARYPQFGLFANVGYGYPGLDFFDDMFHHQWKWTAMAGIRLRWDISSFYHQKQERRKVALKGSWIENTREVFLFNQRLQATQQRSEMRRFQQMLSEDDEIIQLHRSVREAAEVRLTKGVVDVVDLLEKMVRENAARIERSNHEIEMLKYSYGLKYTLNQ